MITDACIYAPESSSFPLSDFVTTANSCGYARIVAVGAPSGATHPYVLRGTLIFGRTGRAFVDAVRKAPKGNVVIVEAGDNSFNRTAITTKGVHLLTGLADLPKGGFDHITAKMAAQHTVGLVIDLSKIIDPKSRRSALSHYADILKFARKYHFPLVIASGASAPPGQKNRAETAALTSLFGMEREETYAALNALDGILHQPATVEIVEVNE
ncbi:MAG: RNase P subunit p30 family protein [Methanocorpusculum sp.]|nr:RNase P subunit p30 family protein [Methanocorpusculum sp.]